MRINPIASSSSGNCYLIDDGSTTVMIDCGLPFNDLKVKTNFLSPRPDACFISHSHGDHARSVDNLMKLGITCYMSKFTKAELGIENYNAQIINHNETVSVGTMKIKALKMRHDVYCLGFYIYSTKTNETLFFATDTYMIDYNFSGLDYIMVEANYDSEIVNRLLLDNKYNAVSIERLMQSHMDIKSAIKWLQSIDLSQVKRIYLLHLSNGSSDADDFRRRVIACTGIPTTVCPA